MRRSLLAAACLATLALGASVGHAAPVTPAPMTPLASSEDALVQSAAPRCHAWKKECGRRWGWNTWRWRRCLALHGCL